MSSFCGKLVLLVWSIVALSCSKGDAFRDHGENESKPIAHQDQLANSGLDASAPVPIFRAVYKFTITDTRKSREICHGEATFIGMTDYQLNPEGSAECTLGVKLNLKDMIAASGGPMLLSDADSRNYPYYGLVQRISGLGDTTKYTPPKPYILGPVIQDITPFKTLDFTEKLHVAHISKANQALQEGDGTVSVKVLETGIAYKPPTYPETFDNVMHWQMTTDGFAGVNRGEAMLYNKWEYYWSIRPIAIPFIRIVGPLSTFIDKPILAKVGGLFTGDLIIEFSLKEHTQL